MLSSVYLFAVALAKHLTNPWSDFNKSNDWMDIYNSSSAVRLSQYGHRNSYDTNSVSYTDTELKSRVNAAEHFLQHIPTWSPTNLWQLSLKRAYELLDVNLFVGLQNV